jgi:hypothetical protein
VADLDVLGHDGHALCVDGAEIGVLEEAHEVRLSSLLRNLAKESRQEKEVISPDGVD